MPGQPPPDDGPGEHINDERGVHRAGGDRHEVKFATHRWGAGAVKSRCSKSGRAAAAAGDVGANWIVRFSSPAKM
ncbi:hypothetical protein GCM10023170_049550 [Phytohabitans houttuyneae]|uniref:Uncharacterized protein n=1 Tax=Phytohabitans houttuyneae TaxID=1076126 RepID=A0A6V8KT59_9ACTN|nr:hypothetical protein Phou_092160 [Phytohabitans houttuyneae]